MTPLRIYAIGSDVDKYPCFDLVDYKGPVYSQLHKRTRIAKSWSGAKVKIDKSTSPKLPDVAALSPTYCLVLSGKAAEVLRPLIGKSAELLPLGTFQKQEFFVLHLVEVIDAVDQENSKWLAYSDGRRQVLDYAFHEEKLTGKHYFQVPEKNYFTAFVSEQFKKIVEQHKLTGATFSSKTKITRNVPGNRKPTTTGKTSPRPQAFKAARKKTAVNKSPRKITRQDFELLEKSAGLKLPILYRKFLASYPQELAKAQYSDDEKLGGPEDFELLSKPQRLIKLNRQMRKIWPKSDYADKPFPSSYLLIGEDGMGNLFAIDSKAPETCPVFEFEHDENRWKRRAKSLDEFVKKLIKSAQ